MKWVNKDLEQRNELQRQLEFAQKMFDQAREQLDKLIEQSADSFPEKAKDFPVAQKGQWLNSVCPVCGGPMSFCELERMLVCYADRLTCGASACNIGRIRLHPDDYEAEFGKKEKINPEMTIRIGMRVRLREIQHNPAKAKSLCGQHVLIYSTKNNAYYKTNSRGYVEASSAACVYLFEDAFKRTNFPQMTNDISYVVVDRPTQDELWTCFDGRKG